MYPNKSLAAFLIAITLLTLGIAAAAEKRDLKAKYHGQTFFLQQNLRFQGDTVHWANFISQGDFLPISSQVIVKKVGREAVFVRPEGWDENLELDIENCRPSASAILERILGAEEPVFDELSEIDKEGIRTGTIKRGMSRRGVFLAVGLPPYYYKAPFTLGRKAAVNHDPNASVLTYMKSRWDFLVVRFEDDKVVALED